MEPPAPTPANQPRAHTCPFVDKNALLFSGRFFFFSLDFASLFVVHYFMISVLLNFCYPVCCSLFLLFVTTAFFVVVEKVESQLHDLQQAAGQAAEYIKRLEQTNYALSVRVQAMGNPGPSDFMGGQRPPDVF